MVFAMITFSVLSISANDLKINQPVLNQINNLGLDVQKTVLAELEPMEMISYNEYSKKDLYSQKPMKRAGAQFGIII